MTYKITLAPSHFLELQKKSYSLDHIFLLKMVDQKLDLSELCKESMKIAALYQGLLRKGLITDEDELTVNGKELLEYLDSKGTSKFVKKKPAGDDFLKWYNTYPGTDTFNHKGKKFIGSRRIRVKEHECRLKYDAIILEGKYTPEQLQAALELEILQKKDISVKWGTNNMTFMVNSLTYLGDRAFRPFVELLNEEQQELPSASGAFDI